MSGLQGLWNWIAYEAQELGPYVAVFLPAILVVLAALMMRKLAREERERR